MMASLMLRAELLPRAAVVTPNIPEAEVLSGRRIESIEDARAAAFEIHQMGGSAVVITGGHAPGDEIVDLLFDGEHLHRAAHDAHRHAEYARHRLHVRVGDRGEPGARPFRARRGRPRPGLRARRDSSTRSPSATGTDRSIISGRRGRLNGVIGHGEWRCARCG